MKIKFLCLSAYSFLLVNKLCLIVAAFLSIRIFFIIPTPFFSFPPPQYIGCAGIDSNTKVASICSIMCLRIFTGKQNILDSRGMIFLIKCCRLIYLYEPSLGCLHPKNIVFFTIIYVIMTYFTPLFLKKKSQDILFIRNKGEDIQDSTLASILPFCFLFF